MPRRITSLLRYLERTHQRLDAQLTSLMSQEYLTPQEQLTLRVLKKKKLATKDQIQRLHN